MLLWAHLQWEETPGANEGGDLMPNSMQATHQMQRYSLHFQGLEIMEDTNVHRASQGPMIVQYLCTQILKQMKFKISILISFFDKNS